MLEQRANFPKIYYYTKFLTPALSSASVALTSAVRLGTAVILALLMAGNMRFRVWEAFNGMIYVYN
jgi:hypothetical protein